MTAAEPASDRTIAWIAVGLAALMMLMGAASFGLGRHFRLRSQAWHSWPTTDAIVEYSGRHEYLPPGESIPHRNPSTVFHFVVDGRVYRSNDSGFLGQSEPRRANEHVRMHYNPDNPQDHAFDGDRDDSTRIPEIIGVVCLLLSLPFWYLAFRLMRARP